MTALVEARGLRFAYGGRTNWRRRPTDEWALRDIELSIARGSALGIVGESGSGKSTLIRVLCGLLPARGGSVAFDGRDLGDWLRTAPRTFRRQNQLVFQNPASSLDPRMRMRQSLAEPTRALERRPVPIEEMVGWLAAVGLGSEVLSRYPHQLSGGQLQRVALARALSVRPEVLYADEPTSSVDVSVQAQILNLLMDLRARFDLTLVMVSHNLVVVGRVCEHIVVMRDGQIVEQGATVDVFDEPRSTYTAELIAAAESVAVRPGT